MDYKPLLVSEARRDPVDYKPLLVSEAGVRKSILKKSFSDYFEKICGKHMP